MNIKKMIIISVYVALINLLTFVPYTGYITIGPFAFTIIPIVIVIATWHIGGIGALSATITFALCSYLRAFVYPSLMSKFITYPLLPIAPKLASGAMAYLMYKFLPKDKLWSFSLTAFLAFVANTVVFVFTYEMIALNDSNFSGLGKLMYAIYLNMIIEWLFAIFVSSALYPLAKTLRSSNGSTSHSW